MDYDVTIDRDKFVGGSDIPIIMGLSPFKTRWQLLLQKAGIEENTFNGNRYTEYGDEMEGKIRDYINKLYKTNFQPDRKYVDKCRFHCDGNNGEKILEIKTTSHIYDSVNDYKIYLVQVLAYTEAWEFDNCILAVYERPDDFSTEFDVARLHIYEIGVNEYKDLLQQIHAEIERFLSDLERLKENPLLTEEDFQPNELVTISNKVVALENRMQEYKAIEAEYKAMKQALFEAMQKYDVKSWETYNGTKITRVDGTEPKAKTVYEFDKDAFAADNPDMYKKCLKQVEKKTAGRSGYVKISLHKM